MRTRRRRTMPRSLTRARRRARQPAHGRPAAGSVREADHALLRDGGDERPVAREHARGAEPAAALRARRRLHVQAASRRLVRRGATTWRGRGDAIDSPRVTHDFPARRRIGSSMTWSHAYASSARCSSWSSGSGPRDRNHTRLLAGDVGGGAEVDLPVRRAARRTRPPGSRTWPRGGRSRRARRARTARPRARGRPAGIGSA